MIMVKCKKCGRKSDAESFVLDNVEKMMLCPLCIKERKTKKSTPQIKVIKDAEGKILKEKNINVKEEIKKQIIPVENNFVSVIKLDSERVKYKCPKCGFGFIYNIVTGRPKICGYCAEQVGKLKINEGIY